QGNLRVEPHPVQGNHLEGYYLPLANLKRVIGQLPRFRDVSVDRDRYFHRLSGIGSPVGRGRLLDDGIRTDPEGDGTGESAGGDETQRVKTDTGVRGDHQPHGRPGTALDLSDMCLDTVRAFGVREGGPGSRRGFQGVQLAARAKPNGVRPLQTGPPDFYIQSRAPLPAQRKYRIELGGGLGPQALRTDQEEKEQSPHAEAQRRRGPQRGKRENRIVHYPGPLFFLSSCLCASAPLREGFGQLVLIAHSPSWLRMRRGREGKLAGGLCSQLPS